MQKKKDCSKDNSHHRIIFRQGKCYKVYECRNEKGEVYYTVVHNDPQQGIDVHRHYDSLSLAVMIAVRANNNYIPPTMSEYLANDVRYLITGVNKKNGGKYVQSTKYIRQHN